MIDRHPYADREDWLGIRAGFNDVTASTVGALRNLDPWTSRLKLYKQKQGADMGQTPVNVRMRRGLRIEKAIAAMVMEDYPTWRVTPAGVYLRDPERRLGCTPDFYVEADDELGLGVLQTKNVGYRTFRSGWMDDDGALMVPPWIVLQTTVEMMLSEADWGAVAAFIDSEHNPLEQDLFVFRLERHPAGEAKILADVAEFWDDVANGREPDVDAKLDGDLVKLLYPASDELLSVDLSADNYLPGALAARAAAKERIKADEAFIEEVDTELRGKMGAAELAFLNGFTVTLKTVNKKAYTVPAVSYRQIRVKDHRPKEETASGEQITF